MINIKANYVSVNETVAKNAKIMNSFSDYKVGTATEEQKAYTDAIVSYAKELLAKNPTEDSTKIEKVQYYIDMYSKRVAAAIDRRNGIDASCPSVMICGAGNFPTRKKERQIAAMNKYYEDTKTLFNVDDSNYYFRKIRQCLTDSGVIKSDDKNAVQLIKDKIAKLETMPDTYGNKKAEIRRLKGRLLQLAPDEMKAGKEITVNGLPATYENVIDVFNKFAPILSSYDHVSYYLNIPVVISDGKRKYKGFVSNQVNQDGTEIFTYGNKENNYESYFRPLTDEIKFNLIISTVSGSGNKAVIYSILKDLLPKSENTTEEVDERLPFKTVKNNEIMRLQLLFDGKPSEEIRSILKSNGFRWSPSQKAWQRLLNDNALYSLKRVSEEIAKIA